MALGLSNATDDMARFDPYAPLHAGLDSLGPCALWSAWVVAAVSGSAAAAAGVGGGGIFMPLYAIGLGLGSRAAVPVSKATILGVAIGNNFGTFGLGRVLFGWENTAGNFWRRHPTAEEVRGVGRPLIDFDVASYMQISLLVGTICGVVLNHVLPELVLLASLASVLCFTGISSLRKGLTLYAKERRQQEKASYSQMQEADEEESEHRENDESGGDQAGLSLDFSLAADSKAAAAMQEGNYEEENSPEVVTADQEQEAEQQSLQKGGMGGAGSPDLHALFRSNSQYTSLTELQHAEGKAIPLFPIGVLLLLTGYLFLYASVRRSAFSGQDAKCVGTRLTLSWLWMAAPFFFFGLTLLITLRRLVIKHRNRLAWKYVYVHDVLPDWGRDMVWDNSTLCKLPIVAFTAGIFSGMLGIGGGMVNGPLLLHLGINSQVSSATTGFMLIFTASSTCIQYIIGGDLPLQWAVLFGSAGYIAGVLGTTGAIRVCYRGHDTRARGCCGCCHYSLCRRCADIFCPIAVFGFRFVSRVIGVCVFRFVRPALERRLTLCCLVQW